MWTWIEDIIQFVFQYGWFFGLIPIFLGIIGAIYFSYYPNAGY